MTSTVELRVVLGFSLVLCVLAFASHSASVGAHLLTRRDVPNFSRLGARSVDISSSPKSDGRHLQSFHGCVAQNDIGDIDIVRAEDVAMSRHCNSQESVQEEGAQREAHCDGEGEDKLSRNDLQLVHSLIDVKLAHLRDSAVVTRVSTQQRRRGLEVATSLADHVLAELNAG